MDWLNHNIWETAILHATLLSCINHADTATCPRDIFSAVFACFRYVQSPGNSWIVAGADLEAVKARCRDGSFTKAVGCVQNLNHVCHNSARRMLLQHMASPVAMERGFRGFCDNIALYAENKECLLRKNTKIQRCISRYRGMFEYDMSRRRGSESAMLETVCNFLRGMTGCIDEAVRKSCDSALADILLRFMQGITPPVCEPFSVNDAKPRASLNTSVGVLYVIVLGLSLSNS